MLPSRCAARSRSDPPHRSGDRGNICLEVEGAVRGTFLVRSWASLTPACGIGKVSAALNRASYTLGPPALGAGFYFRTFDSFFSALAFG
jgi:hypothetical protein